MIPWLALLGSISLLDALPPTLPEVDTPGVDAEVAQGAAADDPVPSSSTDNRVRLYVGQRMFDEDLWEPVEDQFALGLEFSAEKPTDLVGWEGGLSYSFDEEEVAGFDVDASTFEVYGGVHKAFFDPARVLRPYLGAGLAWIFADAEISGVGSEDDDSIGFYAHGGLEARLGQSFYVGADVRFLLGTDIDLGGVSGDGDYTQLALSLGWSPGG